MLKLILKDTEVSTFEKYNICRSGSVLKAIFLRAESDHDVNRSSLTELDIERSVFLRIYTHKFKVEVVK